MLLLVLEKNGEDDLVVDHWKRKMGEGLSLLLLRGYSCYVLVEL